jgi:hypothetical protein
LDQQQIADLVRIPLSKLTFFAISVRYLIEAVKIHSTVEPVNRGGHMPGLRLIEVAVFDPETTRVMGVAYEQACIDLDAGNAAVRELVARRIIEGCTPGGAQSSQARLVWD